MSFIDTILTENPSATVVLVDRNSKPGGHWNHAYPYVKLHQPSCYYGVNSLQLGKNRHPKSGLEIHDVDDRATGAEVLAYYKTVCDNFVKTGRVRCFFDTEHTFDEATKRNQIVLNKFTGTKGKNRTNNTCYGKGVFYVNCQKLVTVATNVTVPSMRRKQPLIPLYDDEKAVSFVPPNDVPNCAKSGKYTHYIVFGNGKTGIDAVVNLVLEQGIDPSQITWILGRDAWYYLRDAFRNYYKALKLFGRMSSVNSVTECFLQHEADGLMGRLDPTILPKVFKGALIGTKEFDTIRRLKNFVRMGRATAIHKHSIKLQHGSISFDPQTTLLVDCMVDNHYGYTFNENFTIFGANRITLGPEISIYSPSFSSAIIAFLECAVHETADDGDNTTKNDYCFFLRGKQHTLPHPETFLGAYYMDAKTFGAVWRVRGGKKFILHSRLFDAAPKHHEGGIRRMMWEWFGPNNLSEDGAKLVRKVGSYGYSDVNHKFGIESLEAEKWQRKRNRRRARWARRFGA